MTRYIIKRSLDIFFAFIFIILLSPVMVITAIMIKIKLGSPVIFKQQRPGKHSKIFMMYKFRTMLDSKDKNGTLLSDEERLTKFGKALRKTSLDELPELFNILKGDMSFVGPRPLLVEYLELYNDEQSRRHEVMPGLTGWAQVNGRNAIDWNKRFELDVWYVDNCSFILDIKIIFMTFKKVLVREGINQQGNATVEKFRPNRSNRNNKGISL